MAISRDKTDKHEKPKRGDFTKPEKNKKHQTPKSKLDKAVETVVEVTKDWDHTDPNFLRLLTYFLAENEGTT